MLPWAEEGRIMRPRVGAAQPLEAAGWSMPEGQPGRRRVHRLPGVLLPRCAGRPLPMARLDAVEFEAGVLRAGGQELLDAWQAADQARG